MEEDEDESVVFENSPLYTYLQETGVENIEAEQIKIRKDHNENRVSKAQSFWVNISKKLKGNFDSFGDLFKLPNFNFISETFSRIESAISHMVAIKEREPHPLDYYFNSKARLLLRSNNILEGEDEEFLDNYLGTRTDLNSLAERNLYTGGFTWWSCVSVPVLLIGVIYKYSIFDSDDDELTSYMLACILVSSGFHTLYSSCKLIHWFKKKRDIRERLKCVQSFVTESESFLSLLKKSLRLIQECELIARGFTLVSNCTPLSLLEQNGMHSSRRQCPELRRIVFSASRNLLLLYKETTKTLINKFPLVKDVDQATGYLCLVPIEEYGPCLETELVDDDSEKHLYSLTDGYSVAALKGMNHLFLLHQSEFIRRLVLCLHPSSRLTDVVSLEELISYVDILSSSISNHHKDLERTYYFYKCSLLRPPSDKSRRTFTGSSATHADDLYTAVHSLELHLQATLRRVSTLASSIEEKCSAEDVKATSSEQEQLSWELTMKEIKSDLQACGNCLDESRNRLGKFTKHPLKESERREGLNASNLKQSAVPPVRLVEIEDPVIVDQVFEAYTDSEEMKDYDWELEKPLTDEEKAKKKKEREDALRLLSELKSVISTRAVERAEKEDRILKEQTKTTGASSLSKLQNIQTENGGDSVGYDERENSVSCDDDKFDQTILSKENTLPMQNSSRESALDSRTSQMSSNNMEVNMQQQCQTAIMPNEIRQSVICSGNNSESSNASGNVEDTLHIQQISDKSHFNGSFNQKQLNKCLSDLRGGLNYSFTANVAAMAAARSHEIGLCEETFGDDSDEEIIEDS